MLRSALPEERTLSADCRTSHSGPTVDWPLFDQCREKHTPVLTPREKRFSAFPQRYAAARHKLQTLALLWHPLDPEKNPQVCATAAIFWLKTRARWKEVSIHEITHDVADPLSALMLRIAEQGRKVHDPD